MNPLKYKFGQECLRDKVPWWVGEALGFLSFAGFWLAANVILGVVFYLVLLIGQLW